MYRISHDISCQLFSSTPKIIQSAWLSVRLSKLGTPGPSPQASVAPPPPPLWIQGGDTLACWGPNSDEGKQTLWYSMYNLIPVRHTLSLIYNDDILGYRSQWIYIYIYIYLYVHYTIHLSSIKRNNQYFNAIIFINN